MNWFEAIPAKLSKNRYLNLTTTDFSNPSSPSHPSYSTCTYVWYVKTHLQAINKQQYLYDMTTAFSNCQ